MKRKLIFKKATAVSIVFLFICIPLFALKVYDEIVVKEAVALSASIIRSGPGKNNPDIFTIPEGKIVSVISESGNWNNVKIESENKSLMGWIENSALGSINA
jgi:uncharacterized protein YraI